MGIFIFIFWKTSLKKNTRKSNKFWWHKLLKKKKFNLDADFVGKKKKWKKDRMASIKALDTKRRSLVRQFHEL